LYLPVELLDKHGVLSRVPDEVLRNAALAAVCRDLAMVAREHYAQADAFMKKCPASAMRPARIMRCYYKALFDQLVTLDWRDPLARVSLPKWKKIGLMLKGFFG
jgi:phytoene synthase